MIWALSRAGENELENSFYILAAGKARHLAQSRGCVKCVGGFGEKWRRWVVCFLPQRGKEAEGQSF
jgi:hypothetical protein